MPEREGVEQAGDDVKHEFTLHEIRISCVQTVIRTEKLENVPWHNLEDASRQ